MVDCERLFTIDLSSAQPVAQGKEKIIYEHPDHPELLVKVHNPALQLSSRRLLHRAGRYKAFAYELQEYVALRGRFPNEALPVERVFGLADTSLGLGLVVEKVTTSDGRLGTSLYRLVRQQGLTAELREHAEAFIAAVLRYDMIFSDMNASNLVLGSRGGRNALVLVDGFGDKNLVPLRSLSGRINRRKNLAQGEQLRAQLKSIALRAPAAAPA